MIVDKIWNLTNEVHPSHPHRVEAYSPHLPDAYNSRSADLAPSRTRKRGKGSAREGDKGKKAKTAPDVSECQDGLNIRSSVIRLVEARMQDEVVIHAHYR